MKPLRKTACIVLLVLALIPASTFAKYGPRPTGEDILAGTPFDVTGEILEIRSRGQIILSVDDAEVVICGFAPPNYFDDLEVALPESGDTIQVNGYIVTQNNREIYIAMSVSIDGDTILFRDATTGEELWERPEPFTDILNGTPFAVTGEVVSASERDTILLATATGDVSICGTGPDRYWEESGVDYPSVGETVTVTGMIVDLNDTQRYIAFSMVIQDDSIQLRDPETGLPLWRHGRGHGPGPHGNPF